MKEKYKSILLSIITGDAFGSVLEGLSRGHIKSLAGTGNTPDNFIEPDHTIIKNRKWRKPGLYTSISQLMITTAFSLTRKNFSRDIFIDIIKRSPDVEEGDSGIFRHTGLVEKRLIDTARDLHIIITTQSGLPSSRIIAAVTPLLFSQKSKMPDLYSILSYSLLFTSNLTTIAGILVYSAVIMHHLFSSEGKSGLKEGTSELIRQMSEYVDDNSHTVFELGLNPVSLSEEIGRYLDLMNKIKDVDKNEIVEKIICSQLNKTLKTPVTRATIDNPLAVIPFAIHLAARCRNPNTASIEAAMEGGAASSLASIAGAVSASISAKASVNESLVKNLENRKRILKITDSIADMLIRGQIIDEFMESEASLTRNEIIEYKSRVKFLKEKPKKKLNRKEKENRLSEHVVESWTKTDRAKWKKQKKKMEKQDQ